MDAPISIRDYSELKLEIVCLKAELEAQKEINSKYQAEFQALLRETNDKYMAEINRLKGIPVESQKPEKAVIASEDIKRCILSALQHNNLEEYIYIVLEPALIETKCKAVSKDIHTAMLQSFSLLTSFDPEPLFQRVDLFASIQYFLVTRYSSPSLIDLCMNRLQDVLQLELKKSFSRSALGRFPPWYVATVLVYYDLCRRFDCVELFKSVLFTILLKAGEFPLYLLGALFQFDAAAFSETTTCDVLVNAIIGSVLHSIADPPAVVASMVAHYAGVSGAWEERVTEIEQEVLQCVLDEEDYAQEKAQYVVAGKCLVLLYVYKGGQYAVESLVNNGIVQRIDDKQFAPDYRTFLLYLVLWIAETNLFGGEWAQIRRGLVKVDVCTSAIQEEFAFLFQ
ncbi:hypothetical protein AV274_0121 [Blastocystis sp. ATCC 50177/Nand II]|uniref:Uncharacterized protein n=1 Tax=Blastocystis sp. subtype 1 (strain ATCC 50177 / NandII) TaxID=478820 RepID=A0A196SPN9_BLAHN|nr:hypothetical protein AV274_0121 [Blastocystis sp. ATCC 50177/Nand II]